MGWIEKHEIDDEPLPVSSPNVSTDEFDSPDQTSEREEVERRDPGGLPD